MAAQCEASGRTLKGETTAVLANKNGSVWNVPRGLDAKQVLPACILHFISTMLEYYFISEVSRHLPLNMWSLVRRRWSYSTDPRAFLVHECGRLGVSTRSSTGRDENAENEIFACRNLEKKGVVRSYYESLA